MKTYRNKPALAYNSHENKVIDRVHAFHVVNVFEDFVLFLFCALESVLSMVECIGLD